LEADAKNEKMVERFEFKIYTFTPATYEYYLQHKLINRADIARLSFDDPNLLIPVDDSDAWEHPMHSTEETIFIIVIGK
jgi:hypothetical protein